MNNAAVAAATTLPLDSIPLPLSSPLLPLTASTSAISAALARGSSSPYDTSRLYNSPIQHTPYYPYFPEPSPPEAALISPHDHYAIHYRPPPDIITCQYASDDTHDALNALRCKFSGEIETVYRHEFTCPFNPTFVRRMTCQQTLNDGAVCYHWMQDDTHSSTSRCDYRTYHSFMHDRARDGYGVLVCESCHALYDDPKLMRGHRCRTVRSPTFDIPSNRPSMETPSSSWAYRPPQPFTAHIHSQHALHTTPYVKPLQPPVVPLGPAHPQSLIPLVPSPTSSSSSASPRTAPLSQHLIDKKMCTWGCGYRGSDGSALRKHESICYRNSSYAMQWTCSQTWPLDSRDDIPCHHYVGGCGKGARSLAAHVAMHERVRRGQPVYGCDKCHGLWCQRYDMNKHVCLGQIGPAPRIPTVKDRIRQEKLRHSQKQNRGEEEAHRHYQHEQQPSAARSPYRPDAELTSPDHDYLHHDVLDIDCEDESIDNEEERSRLTTSSVVHHNNLIDAYNDESEGLLHADMTEETETESDRDDERRNVARASDRLVSTPPPPFHINSPTAPSSSSPLQSPYSSGGGAVTSTGNNEAEHTTIPMRRCRQCNPPSDLFTPSELHTHRSQYHRHACHYCGWECGKPSVKKTHELSCHLNPAYATRWTCAEAWIVRSDGSLNEESTDICGHYVGGEGNHHARLVAHQRIHDWLKSGMKKVFACQLCHGLWKDTWSLTHHVCPKRIGPVPNSRSRKQPNDKLNSAHGADADEPRMSDDEHEEPIASDPTAENDGDETDQSDDVHLTAQITPADMQRTSALSQISPTSASTTTSVLTSVAVAAPAPAPSNSNSATFKFPAAAVLIPAQPNRQNKKRQRTDDNTTADETKCDGHSSQTEHSSPPPVHLLLQSQLQSLFQPPMLPPPLHPIQPQMPQPNPASSADLATITALSVGSSMPVRQRVPPMRMKYCQFASRGCTYSTTQHLKEHELVCYCNPAYAQRMLCRDEWSDGRECHFWFGGKGNKAIASHVRLHNERKKDSVKVHQCDVCHGLWRDLYEKKSHHCPGRIGPVPSTASRRRMDKVKDQIDLTTQNSKHHDKTDGDDVISAQYNHSATADDHVTINASDTKHHRSSFSQSASIAPLNESYYPLNEMMSFSQAQMPAPQSNVTALHRRMNGTLDHDDSYSDDDTNSDEYEQQSHQRKYVAVNERRHHADGTSNNLGDGDDDSLLHPLSSDKSGLTITTHQGDADFNTRQSHVSSPAKFNFLQ